MIFPLSKALGGTLENLSIIWDPLAFVALAVVGITAATLDEIAPGLFNPRGIALAPADRVFVAETG
jgi:hypothetical protein